MTAPTRFCRLCADTFLRAPGGFDVICPRCLREQDNQTLEDALAMTGDAVKPHNASCRALIDPELGCSCGTGDLASEALDFVEAENY
jgi:hypothetical protein